MKKPFVIASLACACAVAAHAGYETSFTGIGASATGATALAPVNGTWDLTTHVTNGEVTWDSTKKLVFDLDDAEYIEFTTAGTAPDTNTVTTVTVKGVFTPVKADALPTSKEMNARAAQVGFVIADVSGVNTYYAWTGGSAADATDWKALTAAEAAAPDVENETELLVTFDYSDTAVRKVSFAVVKGGTSYPLQLQNNSSADIELTSTAANDGIVKGLSCYGSGSISVADGSVEIGIATVGGKKYGTLAAAATAASGADDPTITVVRTPTGEDGTVTLPNGVKIYDPDQKASNAAISVAAGGTATIKATAAESRNGESGPCEVPLDITLGEGSKVAIELDSSAINKEVTNLVVEATTVTFDLQTKTEILAAANPGGNKALNANVAKLRQFIAADTALNAVDIAAGVSTESITTALQADGDNGIPKWESYVLGIETTDSIKPVTAPAGDADTTAITLSIPAIDAATPSGDYTVSYKVGSGAAQSDPAAIKVPLATGTSDIKVVLTPAVQQ